MKSNRKKSYGNLWKTDKGFSLVEVLVCIAIIAIVCLPLFSGFRLSATLNNRAHYTQKITAYAQEELELIKSISVEDYVKPYKDGKEEDGMVFSCVTSGEEWDTLVARANEVLADFNPAVALDAEQKKALFDPIFCEKKNIKISNKQYTMDVKLMPAEYSQYKDKVTTASVNVAGYYNIAEADAVRFPVVSDEINLYDESSVDTLKAKLSALGEVKTDADIMGNMKKTVAVTVESPSSGKTDEMNLRCDVTYSYPADSPKVESTFCVYKASYELYPSAGSEKGTESGGYAFLLARAFRSVSNGCTNELIIQSTGDTNIYFVLGREAETDSLYNFNSITINGVSYLQGYDLKTLIPGEMGINGTNGYFYTNVRTSGEKLDVDLNSKYENIGAERYKALSYAVEIDIYEQTEERKRVAHLEATKTDK